MSQLAAPPLAGLFYNYAPSAVQLSHGKTALFYCSNASSGAFSDHIFCRMAEGLGSVSSAWSEQILALGPSEGARQWDSLHVCDPEVIKGRFWLGRTEYAFCMFYTGKCMDDGDNCNGNQIGAAFAIDEDDLHAGRWVKLAEPVVRFDGDKKLHWGVGQPSATTISDYGTSGDAWQVRCRFDHCAEEFSITVPKKHHVHYAHRRCCCFTQKAIKMARVCSEPSSPSVQATSQPAAPTPPTLLSPAVAPFPRLV